MVHLNRTKGKADGLANRRKEEKRLYLQFLPYIAPAFLAWAVFQLYPSLRIFPLSLFRWDGLSTERLFVGMGNFMNLRLEPTIRKTIVNSLLYIVALVVIQNTLGVTFAVILKRNSVFNRFFRTLFFAPLAFGTIMIGLVWGYIFDANIGILNNLLGLLGLDSLKRAWLTTPYLGIICAAFVHAWHYLGYTITLTLAGLQEIPEAIYEAADVDGVGRLQQFFYITLPLLKSTILRLVILTVCGAAVSFDYIYALNGGSGQATNLDTLAVFMYRSIRDTNVGKTSAIGVIIVLIVVAIYVLQNLTLKED